MASYVWIVLFATVVASAAFPHDLLPASASNDQDNPPVRRRRDEDHPPVRSRRGLFDFFSSGLESHPPVSSWIDDQPPVRSRREVQPPVRSRREVQPPVSSFNDDQPPVRSRREVQPPVRSRREVQPPVSSFNDDQPPVRSRREIWIPFSSWIADEPPVRSRREVQPPVRSRRGIFDLFYNNIESHPPVSSFIDDQPPVRSRREVQPPVNSFVDDQPPVRSRREVQPPVSSFNDDQPPVRSRREVQPPVSNFNDDQPPVRSRREIQPPVSSFNDDQPPVRSRREVQPPVSSFIDDQPPVRSRREVQPPVSSFVDDQSPVRTRREVEPPVSSFVDDQPPVRSRRDVKPSVRSQLDVKSGDSRSQFFKLEAKHGDVYVADFEGLAAEFVKSQEQQNGKVLWYDLYASRPEMEDYQEYQVSVQVAEPVWGDATMDVKFPGYTYTQSYENYGSKPLDSVFSKTADVPDYSSWTMNKGVNVQAGFNFSIGIPPIFDISLDVEAEFYLDVTRTSTKVEKKTYSVSHEITVPPGKGVKAEYIVEDHAMSVPWTSEVIIDGYIAIWYEDKVNDHWLWFYPVNMMANDEFVECEDGLRIEAGGYFLGAQGVDDYINLDEYWLDDTKDGAPKTKPKERPAIEHGP